MPSLRSVYLKTVISGDTLQNPLDCHIEISQERPRGHTLPSTRRASLDVPKKLLELDHYTVEAIELQINLFPEFTRLQADLPPALQFGG